MWKKVEQILDLLSIQSLRQDYHLIKLSLTVSFLLIFAIPLDGHSMNELLLILLAYLIGSIPTSVWVSRYFFDIDIKQLFNIDVIGSGNSIASNSCAFILRIAAMIGH